MAERNIVIVMARCGQSKQSFGMRFERRNANRWLATWAFAIKDVAAKKEGYDQAEVSGAFGFDDSFPGCPHCGSHSFFKCSCGKVACSKGESKKVLCPWCDSSGELSGNVESLSAGGDR